MPELDIGFTDEDLEALETVRRQQGLASLQQAAEWLVKASIRHAAERMSGKRRSLQLVSPENMQ